MTVSLSLRRELFRLEGKHDFRGNSKFWDEVSSTLYLVCKTVSWNCWYKRTLGGMWVGRQVRVAGSELIVADVRRHHEPFHDHDVHRDEVVLDGRDTLGPLRGAPVLFQEESRLSLRFQMRLNEL